MNVKKKIKAFTLLEVMVTLLITTLLVALSFGVYTNFTKGFLIFEKTTTRLTELLQFKNAITSDWFRSSFPKGNKSYIDLFDDQNENFISYELFNGSVIRKSVVNDTFDIEIKNIEFTYLDKKEEIIEQVLIEFQKNNQLYKISLYKEFDLKTRMKYSGD